MRTTLLTLLLTTILSSCSWFSSLKPKETFYCKVNGKAFRPSKDNSPIGGIGSDPLKVTFDKDKGTFSIIVRDSPDLMAFFLTLSPNESLKVQEINLTSNVNASKSYYTLDYAEANKEQMISQNGKFSFTKIDGYNLSGTFEFTCKSAKTGIEYKITDGQFNDISYY